MGILNKRYNYGVEFYLLSVDEGITGYRDDSLEVRPLPLPLLYMAYFLLSFLFLACTDRGQTVKRNMVQYNLPLKIVSYKELYGWTMDEIVECIGKKNNCTYCGVFRRQALDRGAAMLGITHILTGHNADDMAETVLMNRNQPPPTPNPPNNNKFAHAGVANMWQC